MKILTLFNDLILPSRADPEEARKFLCELRGRGLIIGTDEAGRGALAGPMVAAAVFLTQAQEDRLAELRLRDSKKMTPKSRERIFDAMQELGVLWSVQFGTVKRIERDNILRASLWAMGQCVLKLSKELPSCPECVIVDGPERISCLGSLPQWPLIAADNVIPAVSAASVAAKVVRDRFMSKVDAVYPGYYLARNKGYPTPAHCDAVRRLGLSNIHRPSFCRKLLKVKN